jgi:two-component system, cell cycle response regulator DivK
MNLIALSSWNVLAVDDEPDSLEVLAEVLMMHDVNVKTAASGQEALTLLQKFQPTLVITDLSMPGMDGYQLLHKIRHMEGRASTPVIALTAHAMTGDKERILSAGFNGYVSKPLRLATLVSDILASLPALAPDPVSADNWQAQATLSVPPETSISLPALASDPVPADNEQAPVTSPPPEDSGNGHLGPIAGAFSKSASDEGS